MDLFSTAKHTNNNSSKKSSNVFICMLSVLTVNCLRKKRYRSNQNTNNKMCAGSNLL